ncbi:uracil-DNA glycosylase family protein [Sphingomonas jatrophae]|uniref:DNA polymerase n=1 Tax=Sphingomonas jatrophae TaxID=1166337 RepID=A0A1I6JIS9_9SPHN|nr:uracil-DNA glycosylase family protein [Sphingomonas jatrophae]SFR78877.1 DNA polymerase [Sphingomonas jatrophae]
MDMAHAAATLRWWAEAGVDVLVDDLPRDWLTRAPAARAPLAPMADAAGVPTAAARGAVLPDTLSSFAAWIATPVAFPGLPPRRAAPEGDASAGLMLLADMPEMDAPTEALGGKAGKLLDGMLRAIGRGRESAYLATLCPARPAGGRLAEPVRAQALAAARHHVSLAAPRVLLLLGQGAVETFGLEWPAARGRKHIVNHAAGTVTAIATFHPRFLLAHPACKADAWADLRLLIAEFDA